LKESNNVKSSPSPNVALANKESKNFYSYDGKLNDKYVVVDKYSLFASGGEGDK